MNKSRVIIRYCPRCGWLLRASWMAQELLTTFSDKISELSLVPADAGVFDVSVNGNTVWSRDRDNGFPQIKELKQRVRDIISPDMGLGHTDIPGNQEV